MIESASDSAKSAKEKFEEALGYTRQWSTYDRQSFLKMMPTAVGQCGEDFVERGESTVTARHLFEIAMRFGSKYPDDVRAIVSAYERYAEVNLTVIPEIASPSLRAYAGDHTREMVDMWRRGSNEHHVIFESECAAQRLGLIARWSRRRTQKTLERWNEER